MSTSSRTVRTLAAVGAAVVTVGLIIGVAVAYNAWQSTDADPDAATPTITAPTPTEPSEPTPTDAPTTEQTPPDTGGSDEESSDEQQSPGDDGHSGNHEGENDEPEMKPPDWRPVLDGFARDFNAAGGSGDKAVKKWQAKMARWVTPHLAQAYETVDPRLLPNTSVGEIEIQSQGDEAVTAVIHYRGIQPVWVHLQPTTDGWRVTEAEPYTGG